MRTAWPAALVHVFTALGAVCALLATRAALSGAWEQVFGWLGIALIIDGIDGTLARLADVQGKLPRFSGDRLDLVIDYVTYVFVPALALMEAGLLGSNGWGLVLGSLILVSSLFHFSDTQSKTEDHCFVGFPAVWNIVAFYAFAFSMPVWLAALLVLSCVLLTFVPLHWAHPLRTPQLWPITLAMTAAWMLAALITLASGFPAGALAKAVLVVTAAYGVGLALLRDGVGWRSRTARR
jgi:phosphatidylcholine synthase